LSPTHTDKQTVLTTSKENVTPFVSRIYAPIRTTKSHRKISLKQNNSWNLVK